MLRFWTSLRFSAFYIAVFLVLGVYLPFWPVWLSGRGLDPAQVGLLIALTSWIKVIGLPAITRLADLIRRPVAAIALCAGLSLLAFGAFPLAETFMALVLVQTIAALFFQSLIPLGESHTMRGVMSLDLNYGRIRLWGSLAFIAGNLIAGALLTEGPQDLLLWFLLGTLFLTLLSALALPPQTPAKSSAAKRPRLRQLLNDRPYLILLVAAGLLQSSHAVYYGFSAISWQKAGHSGLAIGWLWAVGVIAEILLFTIGDRLVARWGTARLLILAAVAGVLRWSLLPALTDLPLLIAVQSLHGLTFGAAHLATIHFIGRHAPPGLPATAQGFYAAVSGGLMGLTLLASGYLYEVYADQAYLAMMGLCILALPLCWLLGRAGR